MARKRRSARKQSQAASRFERLEAKLALASDGPLLGTTPAAPLLPKIEVSHFGQDISFMATSGPVKSAIVTNGGSGYTTAPSVTINANSSGGTGATASAVLGTGDKAGTVVGITITNPGSGYSGGASITFSGGGGGSGAAASVVVDLSNRAMFQEWASDYIQFITNSGATVAYINVGDYKTDNKHAYDYLRPELGDDGVPWIVTDFLDKLPQGVAAGTIAYLDVANAWHLYDPPANPDGSTLPSPNRNFDGNTLTTDGKSTSPPMNNMYQSFLLVNQINAAVLKHTPAGGAPRKFITHYEADGEGAGAFETDTYYGFGGAPAAVGDAYNPATPNQDAPGQGWSWNASTQAVNGWPVAGYGYTKWLWNHFMPGATEVPDDGIAVPLPAGGDVPDVVFTDAEAMSVDNWSHGANAPYQFGIIKYAQTSWLKYSPGPMTAYTENYWFGENHYMPGPGSSIAADTSATINYVATPVLNAPTTANDFSATPTVTFNQPVDAKGSPIGIPAMGYAIMGTGAIDQNAFNNGSGQFFGGNGLGNGYSTGVWISPGKGGSGYTVGTKDNPNVSFTPQAGDPSKYPGKGFIDTVDAHGSIVSITITDPGDYQLEPSIVLPATTGTPAEPEVYLTAANGYPVPQFPAAPSGGTKAIGFVTVSSQGNGTAGKPGLITGIQIRDWGSGYPQTPNTSVHFAPITTFTSDGGIPLGPLTILDGGSGYTAQPDISIYKPPGGIGPSLDVVMAGDKVQSVTVTATGSRYSNANLPTITVTPQQSPGYDKSPSGPLAGPGGLPVTFDTTVNGTYHWSPVISQYPAGMQSQVRVPTLYAPVTASGRQVAQIVITVLGDHYDTATNKPYYTLSGDTSQTKHYLSGGVNGNGINPNYNGAYVPALDLAGGFPVDPSGRSAITIIDCGFGYSAGAVVDTAGAGYDNQTTYKVTFPAPHGGGTAAEGLLLVNSNGAVTGIVITSAGSGYTTADDGRTVTLPTPGADGVAATAKMYLSNYPTVTITSDTTAVHTPASPYVITGPTDPKNPQLSDPSKGYIVTGIGFTYPGVGYQANDTFTFGFSPPATGGKKPTAAALPALGTKFSANQLPVLAPVTNLAAVTQIHGGANAFNWQISNGYGPGQVASITNLAGGSGYTSTPNVRFSAPPAGGKAPSAKAIMSNGVVTAIVIDENGHGYGYDPSQPVTVTIDPPGGAGTQATATVVLGDVQILSAAALQTVYATYAGRPDLLAAMFNDQLYQDVALPKLSEEFYWPLVWTDFTNPNSTDGTQVPQRAIATFSIESLNRSNTFDDQGNYVPGTITKTCLDAKYQSDASLGVPNTLGGTFSGLSSLTYAQFVDFLNSAATIIATTATNNGHAMTPKDVTFQVYDAAFLPLEWITQANPNRWGAVNEAPIFHSPATGTVVENGPLPIYTPNVSDIGATVADRTLTYALKPGVGDAANLAIDARTGVVSLLNPANYEAKKTYQFVVVATDGGTPALSVEKAITVDVVDVFEVPAPAMVSVPAEFPVVEDVRSPLVFSALPFADGDTPAAAPMSVVLRVPEGAIAARSGAGVAVSGTGTARVFTGTLADLNAYFTTVPARISYLSAANRNGRVPLTVTVSESTSQYAHETTVTSELVIAAVNDAPRAWAPTAFRVTEDVASSLVWRGAMGPVADVDSASVQVTLAVTEGVLEAAPAAALAVAGNGGSLTITGAPADINAFLRQPGSIRYTTAPDSTATQQLTLTVTDGQGGQAIARSRVVVRAVNDAPVVAAFATLTGAVQNMPVVIDRAQLFAATGASDVDSRRTLFVVDQVTAGTMQRWNGTAWVAITAKTPLSGRLVSATDKLRWTPPPSAGAVTSIPAFTVRAWDGRAFSTVSSQVAVRATVV